MTSQIRKGFIIDGKIFDTNAEAQDYVRRPKIKTALLAVTANKAELADWLLENREAVEVAFEAGTIKRVTKSEKKKLEKACEALKELPHDPKTAFLIENLDAVKDSFRWPSVTRMNDEEKIAAAQKALLDTSEGDTALVAWIIANKDAVLAAYKAGIEPRVVSEKATSGLAVYREKRAAEKAAKHAAEEAAKAAAEEAVKATAK
jgi:hypothetical protein